MFSLGGGTSQYVQVDTKLVDEVFGTRAIGSAEEQMRYYKEHFSNKPIRINHLYHAGILPSELANIWEINRDWDHVVVTSVFKADHSEEIVIGLDLPVPRIKAFLYKISAIRALER